MVQHTNKIASNVLISLMFVFPLSGKIVSPKWKSFKGLRLLWRDKIRLNNGIWRAWFIQCESLDLISSLDLLNVTLTHSLHHFSCKSVFLHKCSLYQFSAV